MVKKIDWQQGKATQEWFDGYHEIVGEGYCTHLVEHNLPEGIGGENRYEGNANGEYQEREL